MSSLKASDKINLINYITQPIVFIFNLSFNFNEICEVLLIICSQLKSWN